MEPFQIYDTLCQTGKKILTITIFQVKYVAENIFSQLRSNIISGQHKIDQIINLINWPDDDK